MEAIDKKEKQELVDFGNRVKELRRHFHLSQKEFGDALGLSASFISEVEAAKTKPGYEFFKNLTLIYNVNPNYLHKGEGEFFLTKTGAAESEPLPDCGANSDIVAEMLWYFKRSEIVKLSVLQFYKTFLFDRKNMIAEELEEYEKKEEKNGGI